MKKLFLIVFLAVSAILCGEDPTVISWATFENGARYYSIMPLAGAKYVKLEWDAFKTAFPMSWVKKKDVGWVYVKTPESKGSDEKPAVIALPVHTPPYRRSLGGLVIVTPTISGAPYKK